MPEKVLDVFGNVNCCNDCRLGWLLQPQMICVWLFVTKYSVLEDVQCGLILTCLQEAEMLSGKLKMLKRSQYQQKLCLASLVHGVEDLHCVNFGCVGMVSTIMHIHGVSPFAHSKPCSNQPSSPALFLALPLARFGSCRL